MLNDLNHYKKHPDWHVDMMNYRIKVLEELNPPGQKYYVRYYSDSQTHREFWARRHTRRLRIQLPENAQIQQWIENR